MDQNKFTPSTVKSRDLFSKLTLGSNYVKPFIDFCVLISLHQHNTCILTLHVCAGNFT